MKIIKLCQNILLGTDWPMWTIIRFITSINERMSLKTRKTESDVRWCLVIFNKNRHPVIKCSRKKYAKRRGLRSTGALGIEMGVTKNSGNSDGGDLGRILVGN